MSNEWTQYYKNHFSNTSNDVLEKMHEKASAIRQKQAEIDTSNFQLKKIFGHNNQQTLNNLSPDKKEEWRRVRFNNLRSKLARIYGHSFDDLTDDKLAAFETSSVYDWDYFYKLAYGRLPWEDAKKGGRRGKSRKHRSKGGRRGKSRKH